MTWSVILCLDFILKKLLFLYHSWRQKCSFLPVFFFSYLVNIIITYIFRIRQRVSINNYRRVKCEENILLIKNSLDYRNLAGGFAQQLKNLNRCHVPEIKIGLGRLFVLKLGKTFTKAVFPVCFFLCCIEQLFPFSVLIKCIVYCSYWYLVSETSDDPCQWTKGRLLYRRWCWCWQRKTGNHLLWYV